MANPLKEAIKAEKKMVEERSRKAEATPGPWFAEPEEASEHRGIAICAADAIVATILPEEDEPQLDETDWANANLIAAAPTMRGKLVDTVAWLDREINSWQTIDTPLPTRATMALLGRLTELRDDLAETLRKIDGGN